LALEGPDIGALERIINRDLIRALRGLVAAEVL